MLCNTYVFRCMCFLSKQCTFDVSVDEHSTVSFTLDLYHHYHRQYKVNSIFYNVTLKLCDIGNVIASFEKSTAASKLPYTTRESYQTSEKRSCEFTLHK